MMVLSELQDCTRSKHASPHDSTTHQKEEPRANLCIVANHNADSFFHYISELILIAVGSLTECETRAKQSSRSSSAASYDVFGHCVLYAQIVLHAVCSSSLQV